MRATALIRQWLELELLQERVARLRRKVRQQLQQQEIDVVEREARPADICVRYRQKGRLYEAAYMRPMLEAEVQGILQRYANAENGKEGAGRFLTGQGYGEGERR